MEKNKTSLLSEVGNYYSDKLEKHGDTPNGVDWNGETSQELRFEQLSKVIQSADGDFSINDLGCGYGALLDYLDDNFSINSYLGVDICEDMITSARNRYKSIKSAQFLTGAEPNAIADYGIASGIFNVRLERSDGEWRDHIETTLDLLDRTSEKGFSFNCLTSYSDEDKKRDYLYYADPCYIFDFCKRHYSRHVALLHDYGLYEFTVLVRK